MALKEDSATPTTARWQNANQKQLNEIYKNSKP
jgi:hypothetical protein